MVDAAGDAALRMAPSCSARHEGTGGRGAGPRAARAGLARGRGGGLGLGVPIVEETATGGDMLAPLIARAASPIAARVVNDTTHAVLELAWSPVARWPVERVVQL